MKFTSAKRYIPAIKEKTMYIRKIAQKANEDMDAMQMVIVKYILGINRTQPSWTSSGSGE
jgi:hypothetical protein